MLGVTTTIRLIGHFQSEHVEELKKQLQDAAPRLVLDLKEVAIVDVVRFLGACELEGVQILDCPHYICEWMRLLLKVVEAVNQVWEPDRVGVRLSPLGTLNDIHDDDPETTFGTSAARLSDYGLAYLHIVNPAIAALENHTRPAPTALRMVELMREKYRGTLILAGGFD